LDEWGMPAALSQAVGAHHDPMQAEEPGLAGVVHLADVLVHAMGLGCSGACGPPEARPEVMDLVPVGPDQLADIAARIENQLGAIVAAFE